MPRVRRAARRWDLADRVELVGSLPRAEVLRQVRRCGVLLHPALHEEAGLCVAEALALGTPVVCLDHGGPAEVARWWPTRHVALISPSDPESTARRLAAAVDAFLDDPPDPPAEPVLPVASFDSSLLDVYDQAVELARALPR
jgi:glycosyltransferase involved in cell wall biosynthesis